MTNKITSEEASGSCNSQKHATKEITQAATPSISFTAKASKKLVLSFKYAANTEEESFKVLKGRCAQTLVCLCRAGAKGVTAAEMSNWALRLAAYIHKLKKEYGLQIRTVREEHEGGSHGRYILESQVQIKAESEA